MKLRSHFHSLSNSQGLTLLELMVAISLTTFIVLGLYQMFDRTQKVMRDGYRQVDVLESSRATLELLTRELGGMQSVDQIGSTNLYVQLHPIAYPMVHRLVSATPANYTNKLQTVFFLTQDSQWHGVGYLVASPTAGPLDTRMLTNGVGTLYRYEISTNRLTMYGNSLFDEFMLNSAGNLQRVADGVVNFQLRAYDANGLLWSGSDSYALTNSELPTYVELELGVLEPQLVQEARLIPNTQVSSNYVAQEAGRVHLFRRRVFIRNGNR